MIQNGSCFPYCNDLYQLLNLSILLPFEIWPTSFHIRGIMYNGRYRILQIWQSLLISYNGEIVRVKYTNSKQWRTKYCVECSETPGCRTYELLRYECGVFLSVFSCCHFPSLDGASGGHVGISALDVANAPLQVPQMALDFEC